MSRQPSAWGYLLPMQDGQPGFALRLKEETCSLSGGTFQFKVVRRGTCVYLHPQNIATQRVITVDGHLTKNQETLLEVKHGSLIGMVGHKEPLFVFVALAFSDSFPAPQKIKDNFLVAQSLGQGGFGHVFLLFQKKNFQNKYAMKIVQIKDKQEKQVEREAKIVMELKHPCIISTHLAMIESSQLFIVMEFLSGGDLSQFVKEGTRLPEADVKFYFYQLTMAVNHLHNHNVCHRDIKPENILLKGRRIKLTDFGLAKNVDTSRMATLCGTPLYIAPEIMKGEEQTMQVDLWSMGVLLYLALSGTLPFRNEEAISKKVQYPDDYWKDVSMQATKVVKSLLKVQAKDRPSISQVVDCDWFKDGRLMEDLRAVFAMDYSKLK